MVAPSAMFQSTPACERATRDQLHDFRAHQFQSTPACERATRAPSCQTCHAGVSIHARVRAGDAAATSSSDQFSSFNPRPRASGRQTPRATPRTTPLFQSTPACERATRQPDHRVCQPEFQSTPACERATHVEAVAIDVGHVSIHARVRAGDEPYDTSGTTPACFNPRPRASGRLQQGFFTAHHFIVSIHARVRAGDRPAAQEKGGV